MDTGTDAEDVEEAEESGDGAANAVRTKVRQTTDDRCIMTLRQQQKRDRALKSNGKRTRRRKYLRKEKEKGNGNGNGNVEENGGREVITVFGGDDVVMILKRYIIMSESQTFY